MRQSEVYKFAQSNALFARSIAFYANKQKQQPHSTSNFCDYLELKVLPNHKYLKEIFIEENEEEKFEWNAEQWIDCNDYATIPVYNNECNAIVKSIPWLMSAHKMSKKTKQSAVQLLLCHIGILYNALTSKPNDKSLANMWQCMRRLDIVNSEQKENENNKLALCNENNFEW